MPNLSWLLKVDADTAGAQRLAKALHETEGAFGSVDVATSKTEQKMEAASARAAKTGEDVAKATKRYVSELMTAGVPLERLDRLAKALHQSEAGAADEAVKSHGKAKHAAEEHAEGFKGVGHTVEEAKRSVIGFGEAIGAVLAFEVIKEGIGIVRELGSEILKIAGDTQRLEKSFEFRFGAEGGEQALAYADQFAKGTEFSDDQAKQFVGTLGRAGVEVKELDVYMAAAGDLAAMTGDKINGMGTAIEALSRARLTGAIDMRELRMLGIGVEQLKTLPEYAQKSKDEIRELMKSGGSITEDQVFTLIQKQGPNPVMLGDMANEMSRQLGARMEKVFNLPEQYIQKLSKSASLETLSGKFADILTALDPDGPRGAAIFGSLERAFGMIVGKVAEIDFEKVADEIANEIIPGAIDIVNTLSEIDWVSGARELYGYLKSTKEIVGQILDGMQIAGRLFTHPVETIAEIATTGSVDLKKHHQVTASEVRDAAGLQTLDVAERNRLTDATSYDPLAAALAKNVARESGVFGIGGRPKVSAVEFDPSRPETFESALPAVGAGRADAERAAAGIDIATPRFEEKGRDGAAGYIRGLLSGAPSAEAAGGDLAGSALGGNAKTQESSSPSRRFARLGGYAVDGYVDAIEDGAVEAARAGAGLAAAGIAGADAVSASDRRAALGLGPFAPDSFASPAAEPPALTPGAAEASGGGRTVTLNVSFAVNVGAGAGAREADEAVDRMRARLPELSSALEQLALEAGL